MEAVFAYLHFLAVFALFAVLAAQVVLCRPGVGAEVVEWLPRVDLFYLGTAAAVLASGLARLLWGGKPTVFYTANPVFHAKLGLFVLIGVISLWPTLRFLRWRRELRAEGRLPEAGALRSVRGVVLVEAAIGASLPLLAVLMARGIGA